MHLDSARACQHCACLPTGGRCCYCLHTAYTLKNQPNRPSAAQTRKDDL